MTAKEVLRDALDEMSEEDAKRLLEFWHTECDSEELTAEEVARVEEGLAALATGDVVTEDELRAKYGH